jgi:hypothetical protein
MHVTRYPFQQGEGFCANRFTAQDGGGANPLAAEPSSQPVGKPNAASSGQANIGASEETNRCCVWKLSGATNDGISFFPTNATSTTPKTEMRTRLPPSNFFN